MSLVADRCICLRKVEYSETSQILTLFGREHGLVRVIAKGAHRATKAGASKFGGGIDLLDVADAVFSHAAHKDLVPLTEWKLVEGHRELRRSLRAIYLGTYAAELVAALLEEHDPHPALFGRLEHTLAELATPRIEQSFVSFQLDLLREAGLLPELSACINCGQPAAETGRTFFTPQHGGVVCRNCELSFPDRTEIDPRLLRVMTMLISRDGQVATPPRLPILTRHQTDPINALIGDHVQYASGKRLRLARYVL
jgi:DNA repair protein RecO (recombination protein O)